VTRHHLVPSGGRRRLRGRDQRGAAAVEFALVIMPLMFVLYGLIAFAMMFALKQSMTSAASDAARSAIGAGSPAAQVQAAKDALVDRLDWLGDKYDPADSPEPQVAPCANNPFKTCITVTVTYPYSSKPLVPLAPGLGLVTPSTINSKATVQLS